MTLRATFVGYSGRYLQFCEFSTPTGGTWFLTRGEAGIAGPVPRTLEPGQQVNLVYRSEANRGYYFVDWDNMPKQVA